MMAPLRSIIRRRGGRRVLLEALLVIQVLHLGEHLAQMIQLYVLGWPPAIARGVVSNLDVEKVHFVWNLGVLATLVWLVVRGLRSGWLVATLVWATLHTAEHGFLLSRALVSGVEGAPGVLGAGGWLARQGWDVSGLTTWSRATVHFAWNTVEVSLLALAYVAVTGVLRWRRPAPPMAFFARGVMLGLAAFVPSTASAPVDTLTALAPIEIWIDGLGRAGGVATDAHANLYVSDVDAGTVTRVAPDRSHSVVAGGLDYPIGLALDATGRLLIAEERAGRVVRVEPGGGRTPIVSGIVQPRWLAVDERGMVFISARRDATGDSNVILALRPDGRLTVLADDFKDLEALAIDGNAVFAAAKGRRGSVEGDGVIFQITVRPDGTAGTIATRGPSDRFKKPVGVALDRLGALYLTTNDLSTGVAKAKDAVAKLHPVGAITLFAADLRDPQALTFDVDGHLYVADGGRVLRFRAPRAPGLDALPEFSDRSPITVRGTTEPGARLDVFVNDGATPTVAAADSVGKFAVVVPLSPDTTNAVDVFATAHGGDGLTSAAAEAKVTHDGVLPSVIFQVPPAGGFVRQSVNVQVQATDGASGVANVSLSADGAALSATLTPATPAPTVTATASWSTTAAADGARTLSAVATDRAGNIRSATRVVVVDNTPPDTQITAGPSGDVQETGATFTFTGTDNLTPAASLAFAWRLDGAAFGAFSTVTTASFTGLAEGPHTVEIKARDLAGNEDPTPATRTFTISLRPTVATLSPSIGPVGTLVTIGGSGFMPGATQVSFSGVPAVVRSITPTTLATTVPIDAHSGLVTVTTSRGTGTSPQPFTVTTGESFSVQVLPADAQLVQGTSTTYTISLVNSGGASFTGLATLSVGGLPSGVTGVFLPAATASGGQLRTLTLTAAPSAALGLAAVTITASAILEGASAARTAMATVAVIPGGRTAALGQVTLVDGTPIAGVRLTLAGTTTSSDAGGNFRLLDVPAGQQMLGVDAHAAQSGLPIYAVDVMLVASQATQLAPFRITPPPPPERFVPVANAATAQVVTDPRFPGASVTLPAGVTITGWDGTVKTRIALERLSPEALPVPPPPGMTRSLYQVFFGTPMGGVPSAPLPVTVPNDQDLAPGEKAEIWYYDAAPLPGVAAGWRLAGLGTVSADGSRLVSDPGVGISRFCGVCGVFCIIKNQLGQVNVNPYGPRAGEPVDLGSGFMLVDKTDLVLPGRLPALLRRSYNPQDPFGRIAGFELATGPGWALSIDVVLLQESPSLRRLILPGNARFAFIVQPDGTFTNTTFPDFADAVLSIQPDGGHTLRFKDGTTWRFATGYVPRVGLPIPIVGLSLLVAQSDRNGNVLAISRDRFGAPSRITEPGGRVLTLTVDLVDTGIARLLTVSDPLGRVVRYGYTPTAPFRLEAVTDPVGGLTRYAYNASGGIVSITDPRGITFLTNEYDTQGRVVRQTQADGGAWTFAYTGPISAHISATVTDPRGHATVHRMNNAGFATETLDPLGQSARHERDAVGRITATTDPLGRVRRFAYDTAGNIITITDAMGHAHTFTYESTFNRVASITNPLGDVIRMEHDTTGNLTAIMDPLGNRTTLTYDTFGQPLTATDPLGNTTAFAYDTSGNAITLTDALGAVTRREYDGVSRLIRQIDPLGRATAFGYDSLNRLESILDAAAGLTRLAYDGNGNLLTVTDALDRMVTFTHDTMDRLATRTDALGLSERFEYDAAGNLMRHTDRMGRVTVYEHDAADHRVSAVYQGGSRTSWVYDAASRLSQVTDSAGGGVVNRYDGLGQLDAQITDLGAIRYAYDAAGRRTRVEASGTLPLSYSYDGAGRLTQISRDTQAVTLQYDASGQRSSLTLPNGVTTEYRRDPTFRLVGLLFRNRAGTLGDLAYQYDVAGRIIAMSGALARIQLPESVSAAAYDADNRQLTFGSKALSYDSVGNLASIVDTSGLTTYAWDARNRLVGVAAPGTTASFTYDAFGRRLRKTVNGATTRYVYDGPDVAQELESEGIVGHLRLPGIDTPIVRGAEEFYLADALGSIIGLADSNGTMTTRYVYDAFGDTTTEGDGSGNPFQFTGRENDGTGLYYYRARYYAPSLRRFLGQDLVHRLGANPYAYAGNTPINAVDPFGLDTIIINGGSPLSQPGGLSNSGQNQGLARLATRLSDSGERVAVFNNGQHKEIVARARQIAGSGRPLFIVGHSLGGQRAIAVVNELSAQNVTPDHVFTIDPFIADGIAIAPGVPTTNFYQMNDLIRGRPLINATDIDLTLAEVGHFNITNHSSVQDAIITTITGGLSSQVIPLGGRY
jgi:RHS repeat-associated protein